MRKILDDEKNIGANNAARGPCLPPVTSLVKNKLITNNFIIMFLLSQVCWFTCCMYTLSEKRLFLPPTVW